MTEGRRETAPNDLHQPVLLHEVLTWLSDLEGLVIDATVGMGGHSEAILRANPRAKILALDKDLDALTLARQRLEAFGDRVSFLHGDFRELATLVPENAQGKAIGVLMDIGVSSFQLDTAHRGFSFRGEGPLDMRMDRTCGSSAAAWLAEVDESELAKVLFDYGEERYARRIAIAICRARQESPIETTAQLAEIVRNAVGGKYRGQRIDPATRTFQAVRIQVNDELGALQAGLRAAFDQLRKDGLLCVISFHSLEDRIVKRFFKTLASDCVCPPDLPDCLCDKVREAEILTHKPRTAAEEEIASNPRARSAKLRAAKRIV